MCSFFNTACVSDRWDTVKGGGAFGSEPPPGFSNSVRPKREGGAPTWKSGLMPAGILPVTFWGFFLLGELWPQRASSEGALMGRWGLFPKEKDGGV